MLHSNHNAWTLRASATTALCATLLATGAMAANVTLQAIDVTPAAKTISVGQKQTFTATGTFSNGSRHALLPAFSDIAAGYWVTCAVLISGGVECWGYNGHGGLGDGTTVDSLIPRPAKGITTATAVTLTRGDVDDTSNGGHGCALLASGGVRNTVQSTSLALVPRPRWPRVIRTAVH
jgi:hypothetical protein